MKHRFTLTFFAILFTGSLYAGTFSSTGSGNWNDPTKWSFAGDADGIPDADDDVTINAHSITVNVVSMQCRDITVAVGGTLDIQRALYINGNYTQNGTETGSAATGGVYFQGTNKNISGSGTINNAIKYFFNGGCSRTILAGTTIVKTVTTTIYSNISITNFGSLTVTSITKASSAVTGHSFTNGANATLTIRARNFFVGGTFNASATGNLVNINYAFDPLPTCVGGNYYNLTIISPSTKLSQNTTVANDFTINASGGIDANNFNLTVGRHFTRAGTWTPSVGFTVTMNGSVAQNITNSAASVMTFEGLVVSNPTSVTLNSGTYQVNDNLTISAGTFNANNRTVTFIGDATKTAIIGPGGVGTSLTNGSAMVFRRFIGARAAGYSDMSGCISGQTLADWDDELLLVFVNNPPDYLPSVYGYDETAFDYVPITSASQSLDPGVGYEVYLDSDGNQISFNATTITQTGQPNYGDIDMSGYVTFSNDGWNLIGNPYHANISWDALFAASSGVAIDFMSYDEVAQDFVTVSGGAGELIAPEQGFWVNITSGSPTLTFTESIKSTSTSSNYRSKSNEMFGLRLKNIGETIFTSGTSFRFADSPETVLIGGNLPFKKVPHPDAPVLCSQSTEGKDLKINLLNSSLNTVNVPLKFNVGISGIYTIESEFANAALAQGYSCITLIDNKLNKTIDISNETYQFSAEKGEAENRFTLVLTKTGNCQTSGSVAVSNDQVNINRIGENTLVRLNFDTETSVSISVTDMLGQIITPSQLVKATVQDVYLPIPTDFNGIYLVNVSYNNKSQTRKLFK